MASAFASRPCANTKRVAMMTKATKKPAPERAANTGLTWALDALVRSGSVDGGSGRWLLIGAMVVEVVGAGAAMGAVAARALRGTYWPRRRHEDRGARDGRGHGDGERRRRP